MIIWHKIWCNGNAFDECENVHTCDCYAENDGLLHSQMIEYVNRSFLVLLLFVLQWWSWRKKFLQCNMTWILALAAFNFAHSLLALNLYILCSTCLATKRNQNNQLNILDDVLIWINTYARAILNAIDELWNSAHNKCGWWWLNEWLATRIGKKRKLEKYASYSATVY